MHIGKWLLVKHDGKIVKGIVQKFSFEDLEIRLEAHHIKSWKNYPKLRYKVSNGKTLCYECHHKRGYKLI